MGQAPQTTQNRSFALSTASLTTSYIQAAADPPRSDRHPVAPGPSNNEPIAYRWCTGIPHDESTRCPLRESANPRVFPGGKREPGEDDWSALSREVREELALELDRASFRELGVIRAPAHDQPDFAHVRMACFTAAYRGAMTAAGEVDEYVYVGRGERHLLAPAARAALDLAGEHGLLN
ncbi:NUDIX hydrolase [Actinomadura geliboluensis]|uniref:NUDIX hydrolase n=1 Tax=Actinomadura geliboluensis TaxID=882440 RepID=UPI0026322DEE|nr:NUDIX domain-containing protein [Actinomadura geliboluensis]